MIALILAEFVVAASLSPVTLLQAQAVVADAPKSRKVCHDVQGAFTRTPRRVCTVVVEKQPEADPVPAAPPPAPVATTLGVGMAVVDTQGAPVGSITAIAADTVTVQTGKHQAVLPKSSVALSDGKALIGLSQADLDASVERAQAASPAALKVGAAVKGKGGTSVGTVDAVDAANVTIRLASGQRISIPRSGIAVDAEGGGTIGITAEELEAQVKAAQPAG